MFRNTFQSGFLSILYAIGSKPLQIWRKNINNGYVKRITDFEMQSSVIEICGANVSTCFLSCPSNQKQTLGVKMPFLVLLIKYLKKYFTDFNNKLDVAEYALDYSCVHYSTHEWSHVYMAQIKFHVHKIVLFK